MKSPQLVSWLMTLVAAFASIQPSLASSDGYCNWNDCTNDEVQGGSWCNQSENNCEICGNGSRWCSTSSPTSGYCNWNNCNGEVQGGSWCNQNENNCEIGCGSGSKWCSSSSPPPPPSSGYCNWSNCNGEIQGGSWCNESEGNCMICGNGAKWCGGGGGSTGGGSTGGGSTSRASTTRYWDCSGGACGCAYRGANGGPAHCRSNALFDAPPNNEHGAKYYGAAAISEALGGGNWLAPGCGKCWKVTGTSNISGGGQFTTTIVLKGTNYCPPVNAACSSGKAHFDIAAPGFDVADFSLSNTCAEVEPGEVTGFTSCSNWMISSSNPNENCNCAAFQDPVLREGCENFLSLQWNNPDVDYVEVNCPVELARLPCWEENGNDYPDTVPALCADPF